MRFLITSLVSSVNSSEVPEGQAIEKEVTVSNPNATVQSLRVAAAVAFRLNVYGFSLVCRGSKLHVNLVDEKTPLTESGLSDGDRIVLVSKRLRPENGIEEEPPQPAAKTPHVEGDGPADPAVEEAAASEESTVEADEEGVDDLEEQDGFDEEEEAEYNDAGDLFGRLLEFGNLVELRHNFLTNPQAVMEDIQERDPTLFQLITSNQESFLELINNEPLIRTIQGEKDAEGEEFADEEIDEERAEAMNALIMQMLGSGESGNGEGDLDLAGLPLREEDGDVGGSGTGASPESDQVRILAFAPTEEEERKIQELVQLGFAYEQCKLAFYMSHRSVERAANMLFEHPPQL